MGVIKVRLRNDEVVSIETDEHSSIDIGATPKSSTSGIFTHEEGYGHLQIKGKNADAVFHHAQWAYVVHERISPLTAALDEAIAAEVGKLEIATIPATESFGTRFHVASKITVEDMTLPPGDFMLKVGNALAKEYAAKLRQGLGGRRLQILPVPAGASRGSKGRFGTWVVDYDFEAQSDRFVLYSQA